MFVTPLVYSFMLVVKQLHFCQSNMLKEQLGKTAFIVNKVILNLWVIKSLSLERISRVFLLKFLTGMNEF